MKKTLIFTSLISGIMLLGSCATNKEYQVQRKHNIENAKEMATACFVELNDGTVKNYTSLRLVTGVLKTPYLLADEKTKIYAKDIKAYQNNQHYAISQEAFAAKSRSYVAVECLPGFAVRIAKGKLNIYVRKYYNSQKAVDEFFLQSGSNGEILAYSPELMNNFIRNSPEALEFFNGKKYKSIRPKKLQATAEIFNSAPSLSKK
jgi:hypothetical protein